MRLVASCAALAFLAAGLSAAENAEIKQLKKEIETLKSQEKATVKSIHGQYDGAIKRDKWSEEEIHNAREALDRQERDLLSVVTVELEREQIRERFHALRETLHKDHKIDAAQIHQLREHETAQIKHAEAAYHAKIKQLEEKIHQLEHAPKTSTKPKK